MTAVVTAIIAALLAAVIAAYRERRIELTNLLVAARVIDAQMRGGRAAAGALMTQEPIPLTRFSSLAGLDDQFSATWAEHRGVLARHLTEQQWAVVDFAIQMGTTTSNTPDEDPDALKRQLLTRVESAFDGASAILQTYSVRGGFLRNPGKRAAKRLRLRAKSADQETDRER